MRLVYVAFGWAAGIILAANHPGGAPFLPLVWLILFGLALVTTWLLWPDPPLRIWSVMLIAFTLGGLRFALHPTTSDIARYNHTGGLTVEGVVVAEPDIRDDQVQLRLQTSTVTRTGQTFLTDGLVLVAVPRTADIRYGDRIRATGVLITPAEYDTFSYADFLARSGVFSMMRFAAVEVVATGEGNPLFSTLLNLKAVSQNHINRNIPEPQAALLNGILLGYERGISPEVADAFAKVGASHIIAISGFNMVILSGVVLRLLAYLPLSQRNAALMAIAVIGAYTVFVGANAAVVRAAVMSSVLVIGQTIGRRTFVPASLGFVAIVMSAVNPTVLWDISFQLSFFATLGLALYVDPLSSGFNAVLRRIFPRRIASTVGGFLSEPLIVTLAAQITTLPLVILYFGRLSLMLIPVNLLIIPPQAALLGLGALATITAFALPSLAQFLYWLDYLLLGWTIGVVRTGAQIPFADFDFHVDPRLILLYFVILVGTAMLQATQPTWAIRLGRFIHQRAIAAATVFGGLLTGLLLGITALSRPDGHLHIWLLDVGHSNAVFMQTPGGAHILVDGGRFPSRLLTALGDRMPFYDREIELLIMTQPDVIEYGALPAVLDRYTIGAVITHGQPNLSESFLDLQSRLADYPVVTVHAGYTVELDDGVLIEIMHPQRQPELGDSLDDNTLTLRVRYGQAAFLLTSDLSRDGQTALLAAGHWPVATVLQMPQHGARRSLSTEFLSAAQPQLIVLQSDRANLRGDPEPDTLALVADRPLFRTDEGGAIHLWTDGDTLWVRQ